MDFKGKTRTSLSLKRKIQIIDEVEKFPAKKKFVIAEEFQVHPSTVTAVLKNKEKYRADFQSGTVDTSTQRQRQSKYAEVDRKLLDWFVNASIAIPSLKQPPGTGDQRVEYIAPTTDSVNDCVAPLDFSFLQLTCLEDAEREDPRPQGKGATPKNSDGKFTGRSLRVNNNQLSEIKTMKEFVEKMFVNPMMIGWIDLSFNALTQIDPVLLEFGNLQILYMHGNNITSLREVDKLGGMTSLKKLLLHGNGIEREKGYRNYVLSTIPWLRNFDCSAVTKCDCLTAVNWRKMNNPNKKKKKIEAED